MRHSAVRFEFIHLSEPAPACTSSILTYQFALPHVDGVLWCLVLSDHVGCLTR